MAQGIQLGTGDPLSYRDFKELLLIELALAANGDTTRPKKASDLAAMVRGQYSSSWVREAARQLKEEGWANLSNFGGDSFLGITGRGLEAAEEFGTKHGFPELHEEAEERQAAQVMEIDHPPAPAIVTLDRSTDAFKALDAEMAKVIAELRSSNSLGADVPAETSQRIAELEAGRKLLDAEQIDKGLVERLMLAPLRWIALKASEVTVKKAVELALSAVASFFGFKL